MAFERDFVERFKEDGRNALINYHKGLKQANNEMAVSVTKLMEVTKAGDHRFTQHFSTLAQREDHNLMCLVGPPDRADYELTNVSPQVAAMFYGAYAGFNAARLEQIRPHADAKLIEHMEKVTVYLEGLAKAAQEATGKIQLPVGLMNLAYDSVLAEVEPHKYEVAMMQPTAAVH